MRLSAGMPHLSQSLLDRMRSCLPADDVVSRGWLDYGTNVYDASTMALDCSVFVFDITFSFYPPDRYVQRTAKLSNSTAAYLLALARYTLPFLPHAIRAQIEFSCLVKQSHGWQYWQTASGSMEATSPIVRASLPSCRRSL